jgi:hypothetical protein
MLSLIAVVLLSCTPSLSFQNVRSIDKFIVIDIKSSLYASSKTTISSKEKPLKKVSLVKIEPEPISTRDAYLYGVLSAIQIIPPLALVHLPEPLDSVRRPVSYLYFIVSATILVILGTLYEYTYIHRCLSKCTHYIYTNMFILYPYIHLYVYIYVYVYIYI